MRVYKRADGATVAVYVSAERLERMAWEAAESAMRERELLREALRGERRDS